MAEISKEEMRARLGNIEQIRDLLFGHKTEEYEEIFQQHATRLDKLESELSRFQGEMGDRLAQLQDSLSTEIKAVADSLEKKLKYLSLTTHEETSRLDQEIQIAEKRSSLAFDELNKTLKVKTNSLQHQLEESKDTLSEDLEQLKNQLFKQLEKSFAELKEAKVSRTDFAEVLFELCLKVKGTEFLPDLKEAAENQIQADFLLPNNKEEAKSNSH